MSRFPPGLRAQTAIGCPWHGRCINDTFDGGPVPPRVIATRPAGATWGPSVPIKHQNAPGSKLNVGTDREFGLYIGHTRSVNGADCGVGIGWNRWLYCDPLTDATWLIRAEFTRNLTSLGIQIYLDGVFGRFGNIPPPLPSPRLLTTFDWVPDLPSWNSDYGYTLEFVMSEIQVTDGHGQLAISLDGAEVYIHIYTTTSNSIARNLYGPTNQNPNLLGLSSGISTAGICKVALSGSNEAIDQGVDILAVVTKDLVYEGTQSNSLCWQRVRDSVDYQHESRLYKTSDGDFRRDYEFRFADGFFSVQYDIWSQTFTDTGTVLPYGGGCEHRVFAQNAIYIATYKDDDYFGQPNTFIENWYGINYPNSPLLIDTNTRGDSYTAPSSGFSEFPPTRRVVGTYSPHNAAFTFEIYTFDTSNPPYTGLTYQYL